ncbi:MAG: peptidoglycan DD-metalloendopeptidase family protein [Tetrasphaera sp.]
MNPTGHFRRSRLASTGALLAVLGATTLAGAAHADLDDEKQQVGRQLKATAQRLADAQDDLDDTSAALKAAYETLGETRARLPGAQNAVAQARAAALLAEQRNEQAIADLELAKAEQEQAERELADTTARIRDTRATVAAFAANLYQEQGLGEWSAALSAGGAQDFADRMAMADTVAEVQTDALGSLNTSAADLAAQRERLTATRRQVAAAQAATEIALGEARSSQATAEQAERDLESLIATQEVAAADLDAERRKEKTRIAGLQSDSDALTAKLAKIGRQQKAAEQATPKPSSPKTPPGTNPPPSTNPSGGGFLSAPSSGWVSSEFGLRFHPILHYWRLHSGRDYAAACGTPIYAAAPGSVVSAGWGGGYGNQVVLSHGIQRGVSLATTYNHMSRIVAYSGSLTRGQLVGYVGTTGLSTGCHLHFETRENGTPVDPRRWL